MTESQLLADALEIKQEVIPNANTAERVGTMLENIIKSATKPFDTNATYAAGQYVFFADYSWRCLVNTQVGESPVLAPSKWRIQGGKSLYRRGAGATLKVKSVASDLDWTNFD